MEDNRKIKTIITRINHICDKENKSLQESTEKYNLTPVKYLKLIGLDIDIDKSTQDFINELFQNKDSRIYHNLTMKNIHNDCIEISSKTSNKSMNFIKDEIRLYECITTEDDKNINETIKTIIIGNNTYINYNINKIISKEELSKRIISQKYNIKHANIKVMFKVENNQNEFEFTINNDLIASDLDYAKRLLDNKKIKEAYYILSKYPSDYKIIQECNKLV